MLPWKDNRQQTTNVFVGGMCGAGFASLMLLALVAFTLDRLHLGVELPALVYTVIVGAAVGVIGFFAIMAGNASKDFVERLW
jgi:hypothetical protein